MTEFSPDAFSMEAGPMGPIGEGEALILRVNRNCPWNRCLFCHVYKGTRFNARSTREIIKDIDAAARTWELLENTSWEMGLNGRVRPEVIIQAMSKHPPIYGEYPGRWTPEQWSALMTLNNVGNWMLRGAGRVFLQDANALNMKPKGLADVLHHLKKTFPFVETITCYARSRTCDRRSADDFEALREAGLTWAFVGIESGCDEILADMQKGVTREAHIRGGRKFMASGLRMAAFIMPGLAGNDRDLSQRHAIETATVLNEIRPTEIRIRSLAVQEGTPLFKRYMSGDFAPPSEDIMIEELGKIIERLDFDATFETLQMTNPLFTVKGPFFELREPMLEKVDRYRNLTELERAKFLFSRYVNDGYLSCVEGWGKCDMPLMRLIREAGAALEKESHDAVIKVEEAVFAIKSKGVP